MPNQVLEGVQSRIKSRLDSDLQADSENKRAQAEGLHKIIWDPDASDDQRERAQASLEKLYPQNKDLLGKIRETTGKVFGFLKAPPTTRQDAQAKSQSTLNQVTEQGGANAAPSANILPPPPAVTATAPSAPQEQQPDPNVTATYSGMLPPPPAMTQPAATVQQPAVPLKGTPPYLPPPPTSAPSMTQDVGSILRTKAERTKREEIDKEQRVAGTARETTRLSQDQQHTNAMKLAEQQKKLEQQYGEHWTVTSQYLYNQATGEWELLPAAEKSDSSLTIPELAYKAANGDKTAQDALDRLKKLDEGTGADPYQAIIANGEAVMVPRSLMGLPRAEIERMAKAGQFQAAPRTVFNIEGMPSVAGQTGLSMNAPPTIPDTTQNTLSAWKQSIDEIEKDLLPGIEKQMAMFGPAFGRAALFGAKTLSGYGLTPEQETLIVQLKETLMGRAFGEGGKQLTPTELEVFKGLLPEATDTYSQAIVKAKAAAKYLRTRYEARLSVMPANQRRQMESLPPPPTGNVGAGTGAGAAGPAAGTPKPGSTFPFNGRTYRVNADGSATEVK